MSRISHLICGLAFGVLAAGPADATSTFRDGQACRAHIAQDVERVRRDPNLASFSDGGWHRASVAPHLATPLMAASFDRYCQQGGRLGYLDYVRTFARTNGFFRFSLSPDEAARRLGQDASLGSRAVPEPQVVVLTDGMPRPHGFASLTGLRLNLPELREGVVHIGACELFAVVRANGRVMVLWEGRWMELHPDRAP